MTVDRTLEERFRRATLENRQINPESPGESSETAQSGDSGDGGMNGLGERVTRVEVRLDAVEKTLGRGKRDWIGSTHDWIASTHDSAPSSKAWPR